MKNILILILFIIILNLKFYNCNEVPQCYSYENDGHEENKQLSWYIFQLVEEKGLYYWNDQDDKIVEMDKSLRLDAKSPFLRTFQQIKVNGEYNYVTYNDQPSIIGDDKKLIKINVEGGHTKGFFIWNDNGGVHVMHSFPKFPQFKKTNTNGKFNLYEGLGSFHNYQPEGNPKQSSNQHAQYAHCYPISKDEIKKGYIYRYLVLTNSIIGIVNDLEVRRSLSILALQQKQLLVKQSDFPRVNLAYSSEFINSFNTKKFYTLPGNKIFTVDKITEAILSDIPNKNKIVDQFPLYILARHAAFFVRFSANFHFESSDLLSNKLNFYQRDKVVPWVNINNGKETILYGPTVENKNNVSIWKYISELSKTIDGKKSSLLGDIFLQTQHYDNEWVTLKNGTVIEGKGLIPRPYGLHIRLVNRLNIGGIVHIREKDHSKQAFSVPKLVGGIDSNVDDNYNWFCVGDTNFMTKQAKRGGSVHCFKSKTLSEFFAKKVTSFNYEIAGTPVKEQTVEEFDGVKSFIYKLLRESLSRTLSLNVLLNKFYPKNNYFILWTKVVKDNYKEFKSDSDFKRISNHPNTIIEIAYPICISSFYGNPSLIICGHDKINCNEANSAYFLCTKPETKFNFQMINPLTIVDDQNLYQLTPEMKEGHQLYDTKEINTFLQEVLFHSLVNKILGYFKINNSEGKFIVSKNNPKMPPIRNGKLSEDSITKYCKTVTNTLTTRHIYGNCLDVFFYCLKFEKGNNIGNYNKVIATVVGKLVGQIKEFECTSHINYRNNIETWSPHMFTKI